MTFATAGGVCFVFILIYNNLVRKKNQVANAFAGVDVLLKKRFDLIPNLTQAVKGYIQHETGVLRQITAMRTRALSGTMTETETADMDREVTGALGRIMAIAENYPDLKASDNFLNLQASLNEVEEQISAARRFYNTSVKDYNNAVETFPANLVAALLRYRKKVFFQVDAAEAHPVDTSAFLNS